MKTFITYILNTCYFSVRINSIFHPVGQEGKALNHMSKTHNSLLPMDVLLYHNFHIYNKSDKNQQA
jgi:hypothetical protein